MLPNLGNDLLTFILDLTVAIAPPLLSLLAAIWLAFQAWFKRQEAKNATLAAIGAVAERAVLAAEQAVEQTNPQAKYALATTLLHAAFPRLDTKATVAAIESAVATMKMQPGIGTVASATSSPSVKPILDALGQPSTVKKLEGDALTVWGDVLQRTANTSEQTATIVKDVQLRVAAMEKAAVTPPASSAKKVVATVTAAAPAEAPVTDAAPAQP